MPPIDPNNPSARAEDWDGIRALVALSPFSNAFSLQPVEPRNRGGIALRAAYGTWLQRSVDEPSVHPAAIAGVLDTSASMAAYSHLNEPGRIATLDMRCDFLDALPAEDFVIEAYGGTRSGNVMFVNGEFRNAQSGSVFGSSTISFSVSRPGSRREQDAVPRDPSQVQAQKAKSFEEWIHLSLAEKHAMSATVPYRPEFAAMDITSRMHGGSVASSLVAGATALAERDLQNSKLATFTISFHTFGEGETIELNASDWRMRRTLASLYMNAAQGERPSIAHLAAHFTHGNR